MTTCWNNNNNNNNNTVRLTCKASQGSDSDANTSTMDTSHGQRKSRGFHLMTCHTSHSQPCYLKFPDDTDQKSKKQLKQDDGTSYQFVNSSEDVLLCCVRILLVPHDDDLVRHLASFLRKLNVDTMLITDLCYYCTFTADDLSVILGRNINLQLETLQLLGREQNSMKHSIVESSFYMDSMQIWSTLISIFSPCCSEIF